MTPAAPVTWQAAESAGRAALARGERQQAEAIWRLAIQLNAEAALGAWAGLGLLCQESGRRTEAEHCYRASLALRPRSGPLWHNLGALLKSAGRHAEARAAYGRALECDGDYPEGHYNIGNLYEAEGDMLAAEAAYQRAIDLRPDYAEAHYNLGIALRAQGRLHEAEAAYRRAIALRADYAEARNNLGLVLQARDGGAAAESTYRETIACAPRYAEAHNNLGVVLQERQAFAEAEQEFLTALDIRPHFADARWNLALMRLMTGRYAEAWPDFDVRTAISLCQTYAPPVPFPAWQGEDLRGKSILVWPEQGFGDELQCCRYVPLLKARGAARIVVACKPPLQRLFAALPGVDAVIEAATGVVTVPNCDYWVFTMSLPARFASTLETLPAALPYLSAPPLPPTLAEALADLPAGRRVGLVWRGSASHPNDRQRSLPGLATLLPLAAVPGVVFVSLQGAPAGSETAPPGLPLLRLGDKVSDFADTAAVLMQLDLVITVDTAIAHLAGALGRPTWVLLPHRGQDWRWLTEREDSPWYPGVMRLFRQPAGCDWTPVVARVAEALAAWAERPRADAERGDAATGGTPPGVGKAVSRKKKSPAGGGGAKRPRRRKET